jgi:hypothetical protein
MLYQAIFPHLYNIYPVHLHLLHSHHKLKLKLLGQQRPFSPFFARKDKTADKERY